MQRHMMQFITPNGSPKLGCQDEPIARVRLPNQQPETIRPMADKYMKNLSLTHFLKLHGRRHKKFSLLFSEKQKKFLDIGCVNQRIFKFVKFMSLVWISLYVGRHEPI